MKYQGSSILNKWVSLHCNNEKFLFGKHREQLKKPRIGDKFVVVGANTYLGWSTICQLTHKFPGAEIVCLDEDFIDYGNLYLTSVYPFSDRLNTLKSYYNTNITHEKIDLHDYDAVIDHVYFKGGDVIIYLSPSETGFDNFMTANENAYKVPFLYADSLYRGTVQHNRIPYTFPVLNIKYGSVIGTYNLITLIDERLSPHNVHSSAPNHYIYQAISCRTIEVYEDELFDYVTSLENITRAIVKSLRKGWEDTKVLRAIEAKVGMYTYAQIVKDTLKLYYDIDVLSNVTNVREKSVSPPEAKDYIEKYKVYLDKFRISLRDTVAYSVINVMENNTTEIHKGQTFRKIKHGKKIQIN